MSGGSRRKDINRDILCAGRYGRRFYLWGGVCSKHSKLPVVCHLSMSFQFFEYLNSYEMKWMSKWLNISQTYVSSKLLSVRFQRKKRVRERENCPQSDTLFIDLIEWRSKLISVIFDLKVQRTRIDTSHHSILQRFCQFTNLVIVVVIVIVLAFRERWLPRECWCMSQGGRLLFLFSSKLFQLQPPHLFLVFRKPRILL